MPTHGDGRTATEKLAPQKCRVCAAVLLVEVVPVDAFFEYGGVNVPAHGIQETVACPNGCEECV